MGEPRRASLRSTRRWAADMILGCNPGASGAIALINAAGDLLKVADMPIVEIAGKKRISAPELSRIVREWQPQYALVERVGAMPKQGVSSTFNFGYSAGMLEGVLAACGVSVDFVAPQTWKKAVHVTADKGSSRLMAQRLWPAMSSFFSRVKDDGRAEAALIARYWQSSRFMGERTA
jgi:crossover junction endodeoxyribonuclease RuvC